MTKMLSSWDCSYNGRILPKTMRDVYRRYGRIVNKAPIQSCRDNGSIQWHRNRVHIACLSIEKIRGTSCLSLVI